VGKVEAGHIHASREEPGQDVAIAGRAQGADDLSAALVTQHEAISSSFLMKPRCLLSGERIPYFMDKKPQIRVTNLQEIISTKISIWRGLTKYLSILTNY
jgi:hypothetical protein